MWNPNKSVVLSSICTKIAILLVLCFAIAMPGLLTSYIEYTGKNPELISSLKITLYSCILIGLIALVLLDRLISNIRKGEIFIEQNVKILRALSWCSFAVSIILLVSGFYYLLFIIVGIAAAFLGLILRVVKNVIEQAIIIKSENDFTI